MKKLYFLLTVFAVFAMFATESFAVNHKINILVQIRCGDNTRLTIFNDTINEGTVYTIKPKTLDAPFSQVQPLYNAMVSSYFMFEQGSLTEDIQVRLTFSDINCSTGLYLPTGGINYFMFFEFKVFDFDGIFPKGEPYNFASPNQFRLVVKKTAAFNQFLNLASINPLAVLALAYYVNGVHIADGITIPTNNADSLVARIAHFSNIVGGDRSGLVDVKESGVPAPTKYMLEQNYPNPFNPSTVIKYAVPHKTNVELSVYNVLGSKVATLVSGVRDAGNYEATFNAADLPSGIYIYEIKTSDFIQSHKMLLMK